MDQSQRKPLLHRPRLTSKGTVKGLVSVGFRTYSNNLTNNAPDCNNQEPLEKDTYLFAYYVQGAFVFVFII